MGGALRGKISYRRCDATRDFQTESAKGLKQTSRRFLEITIDYKRKDKTLKSSTGETRFWSKLKSVTKILIWIAKTIANNTIAS